MTICKTLARRTAGDREIIAEKRIDKYSNIPHYSIIIAKDGIAISVIPTARTTWRRAFNKAE